MEQCNDGGVEVVTLLSPGRGGDIEQLTVYQYFALCSFQAKWRENLDSLAGCGIIGTEHLFHLEIVWRLPGDLVFYRASHPGESSLENENGRWHGKSMHNARLC